MEREPSREQLQKELTELRQELEALKLEKVDLEIIENYGSKTPPFKGGFTVQWAVVVKLEERKPS